MHGFNQSRVLWTGIQGKLDTDLAYADDDDDSVPPLTPCDGGVAGNTTEAMHVWKSNAGPCLAAWAVRKLREAPQPFFLYYSSQAAHVPQLPPATFLDQGPVNGASGMGNEGDMMIEIDRAVGSLVDVLRERGVLQRTLVLVTADNGQGCRCAPTLALTLAPTRMTTPNPDLNQAVPLQRRGLLSVHLPRLHGQGVGQRGDLATRQAGRQAGLDHKQARGAARRRLP